MAQLFSHFSRIKVFGHSVNRIGSCFYPCLVGILDAHSNNVICPITQHRVSEYRSLAPWAQILAVRYTFFSLNFVLTAKRFQGTS